MRDIVKKIGKNFVKKGIDNKVNRIITSIFYKKTIVGQFRGLYDYCNENNNIINVFKDEPHTGRAPSQNEYELEKVDKFQEVTSYKVYLARIDAATIYGCSDIIRVDSLLLTDKLVYDLTDFGRYNPRWIIEIKGDRGLFFEYRKKECIPSGIYLVKMWSENWTHFLVETISRLQFLDNFPEYDSYPILLDEHLFCDERNIEVIKLFNTHNHPIIKIKKDVMYTVEELIYPAQFSWFLFDREKSEQGIGWAISSEYLKNVRKVFWDNFGKNMLDNRREKYNYYLARGNNKRLVNEDEVVTFFKQHSFKIIDTSKMNLKEEVACFMNAKSIVCMMGSGLANMIFCDEDTTVVEFCPIKLQHDSFAMIADPLGIKNYHRINVEIVSDGEQIAETQVNVSIEKLNEIFHIVTKDAVKK